MTNEDEIQILNTIMDWDNFIKEAKSFIKYASLENSIEAKFLLKKAREKKIYLENILKNNGGKL